MKYVTNKTPISHSSFALLLRPLDLRSFTLRACLCALACALFASGARKGGRSLNLHDVDSACPLYRSAEGLVVLPVLLLAVRLLCFYGGAKCGVNVGLCTNRIRFKSSGRFVSWDLQSSLRGSLPWNSLRIYLYEHQAMLGAKT